VSVLFVFDESSSPSEAIPSLGSASTITLLPLTGNWRSIRQVEDAMKSGGHELRTLDAARRVDAQVEKLCRVLPDWVGRCADLKIKGKPLAEWLELPGGEGSAFWLGPMAEKNPLKTSSFLLMAQALAVEEELRVGGYEACLVALDSRLLRTSVRMAANSQGIRFEAVGGPSPFKAALRRWAAERGFLAAGAGLLQILWRALLVRLILRRRRPSLGPGAAALMVTYFPYLDVEAAARGEFRNRYFLPLQDLARREDISLAWLFIFIYVEGGSFAEAARTARRLAGGGLRLAFLEEFLGFPQMLVLIGTWLARLRLYFRLCAHLPDALAEALGAPACVPMAENLLRRTFYGLEAMRGLFVYHAFRGALSSADLPKVCIYLYEMQGWEAALNVQARAARPPIRTIGFQHTSVGWNDVFYRPTKVKEVGAFGPPLPERILCNGNFPYSLLREWGYPNVAVVESLRQLPLGKRMAESLPPRGVRPVLLVASSIERTETAALLSLIEEARPKLGAWRIVLKGHPSMPLDPFLREMGLNAAGVGYEIGRGDISRWLWEADVALVPTSSVAVEVLAYGGEVLVPVFASVFVMNPLSGNEDLGRKVHSPDELVAALGEFLEKRGRRSLEEKRAFVRDYWCLDPELSRWERVLAEEVHAPRDRARRISA
jgi:surface carbohydrate biosynthesis protein (TIGR04326 family)